jgi:hypothetical protein
VVQDLKPRQTRFEGFQVVDQVVNCTVDIHGEWYGCFRLLLIEKLISAKTVSEVVREQGPFSKLHIILVEKLVNGVLLEVWEQGPFSNLEN